MSKAKPKTSNHKNSTKKIEYTWTGGDKMIATDGKPLSHSVVGNETVTISHT